MNNNSSKLAVFKGKNIRRTIHNNEWWFAIVDVVTVLTDSLDPRQYIKKMRQRDSELDANWGTICTPLQLIAQTQNAKGFNENKEAAKSGGKIAGNARKELEKKTKKKVVSRKNFQDLQLPD